MFTATADLEGALAQLAATALGLPRDRERLPVAEASAVLATDAGVAALRVLAERVGVPASAVPEATALARLFEDEILSMCALKLHQGRNVYSSGKLAIWNALWTPFAGRLEPDAPTLDLARELVALRSHEGHEDVNRCADLVEERLRRLQFSVEKVSEPGQAPILVASRAARGMVGRIILYGHYDAEAADPKEWDTDPWALTPAKGRLYGCAIGDNKGALAARLVAIESMDRSPELTWILQGEEELGSPFAHRALPAVMRGMNATLWLEENGYHDLDGTQRFLARTIEANGGSAVPDDALRSILARLEKDASDWGVHSRLEVRGLNKSFFATGCPFNKNLPAGARYLAIGVNDPASRIHRSNESVPTWTFPLHARQLATVFDEVDRLARGEQ